MEDLIIILSGFAGVMAAGAISVFMPAAKPGCRSERELFNMAMALVGLCVGVIAGDVLILQNFF